MRLETGRKDHHANMMIRKLDASASRIKEQNQKEPTKYTLVPNPAIHKALV